MWNLWTTLWSTLCFTDFIFLTAFQYVLCKYLSTTRDFFYTFFIQPIEEKVSVKQFIYFFFMPIAVIPLSVINACYYTLPYFKRRKKRRSSSSRSRYSTAGPTTGCAQARYQSSLRCRRNVIIFKRGKHQDHLRHRKYSDPRPRKKKTEPHSMTSEGAFHSILRHIKKKPKHLPTSSEGAIPSLLLYQTYLLESLHYWKRQRSLKQPTSYTSSDVVSFLTSFDVLQHYHTFTSLSSATIPKHYNLLPSSTTLHKRILLEARGLQTTLGRYNESLPLISPSIFTSSITGELPIVIDTGASCSITPLLSDFTSPPTTADTKSLGSLTSASTTVTGQGPIEWKIEDMHGVCRPLPTTAYLVPEATVRLFSPQVYIRENPTTASLYLNSTGITLTMACATQLHFPIQDGSNLPIMLTQDALSQSRLTDCKPVHVASRLSYFNVMQFICTSTFDLFTQGSTFKLSNECVFQSPLDDAVFKKSNHNLSTPQQELLLWHYRLGHINLPHVQSLLQKPRPVTSLTEPLYRIIQPSNNKSSHCPVPLCSSCQYAKQKRTKPPSHTTAKPVIAGGLSDNITIPGQRVSVDLYVSATKGRLLHTFGKEKYDDQYSGGAIFVDHASKFIFNNHQLSTTTSESVMSKHLFETYSESVGVKIKEYLTDNNPFHGEDWKADCDNQGQTRFFSGVGAHHQNYAERNIQTIFNMARAMLIHFAMHWPQVAETNLWPFAVDHAVYLWNRIPNKSTKLAPIDIFTTLLHFGNNDLQRLHVFGCPVYVLDPSLQDAKKLPKWSRRSRRGIYLGLSKVHSSNVHLVLHPETGHISPQYHLVFDDTFSTVYSDGQFDADVWSSLVSSNLERHSDADVPSNHSSTFNDGEIVPQIQARPTVPPTDRPISVDKIEDDLQSLFDRLNVPEDLRPASPTSSPLPTRKLFQPPTLSSPFSVPEGVPEGEELASPSSPTTDAQVSSSPPTLRRSQRTRRPIDRMTFTNNINPIDSSYFDMFDQTPNPTGPRQMLFKGNDRPHRITRETLNQQFLSELNWAKLLYVCKTTHSSIGAFMSEHNKSLSYDNLVGYLNPALFSTMANKEDNPTFKEAMCGPDAAGFIEAMEAEIVTLIELGVFDILEKKPGMKVISGVWALKRKRYPDGRVRKLKGRYCARGFEQIEGVDYFETFSPVVMWISVRLLLIMSILLNLETTQIDYTAAFVHAPIDCLVYVDMPPGFKIDGHVWKLKKSLYGLAQSPRNYFLYTKEKLLKMGFYQSDSDPCLFISDDIICLIYVDDALFFYKNKLAMASLTDKMKTEGMLFREEESVAGYLGVHIDRKDDGSIHLTQQGLAERIVEALHLSDTTITPVETPCTKYLPIDENGEPAHGEFSYPSVVGQLNYLQGHSRPDTTLATSQVARFVHSPKRSHELALIRIGRYLKGTADKGIILRPLEAESLKTDVYVDAAFACGWGSELGSNPESVKSRTGYIIEIANCPVLWVSKLQSTIATSTMESEYTALSMALRAAIPLLAVIESATKGLNFTKHKQLTFKATVHEDNQGALILANLEPGRHTPRSKFYALRLHWFRSWLIPKSIEIQFVSTHFQKADYLTKPLNPAHFQRNRSLSMGW